MIDEGTPMFERGDVVYGDDPFKGEEDARPRPLLDLIYQHTVYTYTKIVNKEDTGLLATEYRYYGLLQSWS